MNAHYDPAAVEKMRLGPIKVVEVFAAPAPTDKPVVDSIGNETVPFDQIRHLVSAKPLGRAFRAEPKS